MLRLVIFSIILVYCHGFNSPVYSRIHVPVSRISSSRLLTMMNEKKHEKASSLSNMFASKPSELKLNITNLNRLVGRCSWISWWIQITLSVISGVILTFANTVRRNGSTFSYWSSGFALSAIGVLISFFNCFWTWNITRLTRRVAFQNIDRSRIIPTFRRYFRFAVIISLCGMLISLLGAEQIVGVLASKVLSSQGFGATLISNIDKANSLQALDIFLVQANTNIIVAHFAPLLLFLFAQTQVPLNAESLVEPESPAVQEEKPSEGTSEGGPVAT